MPSVKPINASKITSLIFGKLNEISNEPMLSIYSVCFIEKKMKNNCDGYLVNFSINSNVRFTRNLIKRSAAELFVTLGNEPSIYFLKKKKNIKTLSKFQNIERWDLQAIHFDPESCQMIISELKESTDRI